MSEEGVTVTQSFVLCCWAERAMGSREQCCGSVLSPARVCSPASRARVCSPPGPARVCSPMSPAWVSAAPCVLPESLQPHASSPSLQPRESHPSLQPHRRQLAGFPVLRLPTLPEPTSIVSVMPSNGTTPWIPRRHNCKEMPKLSVPATSVSWPGPHFRGSRKACGDWSPRVPGLKGARAARPPGRACSGRPDQAAVAKRLAPQANRWGQSC